MNEHEMHMAPVSLRAKSGVNLGGQGFSLVNLVIVVLIITLGWLWWRGSAMSGFGQDWQAVFLSNGQVYFGKVVKQNKVEIKLADIYYLQVTRPLQQAAEGQEQANPQGELSLVKLGNELHGPSDIMYINRDQVLFVEDLKDDSNVVTAIANYKDGQAGKDKAAPKE